MSDTGSGSTVFVPVVPDQPYNLLQSTYPDTSKTSAGFSWTDGQTGGKPILDYKVEYDQAIGSWVDLQSDVTIN